MKTYINETGMILICSTLVHFVNSSGFLTILCGVKGRNGILKVFNLVWEYMNLKNPSKTPVSFPMSRHIPHVFLFIVSRTGAQRSIKALSCFVCFLLDNNTTIV
jgi:hypothetical protein